MRKTDSASDHTVPMHDMPSSSINNKTVKIVLHIVEEHCARYVERHSKQPRGSLPRLVERLGQCIEWKCTPKGRD